MAGACVSYPTPGDVVWERREAFDVGQVCLWTQDDKHPLGGEQRFEADAPVRAVASTCFSSSCERDVLMEVTAEQLTESGPLVLHTRVIWERAAPLERWGCTNDCGGGTSAVVDVPPFPTGMHQVMFDDQTMTVEVPGVQLACFERVGEPE